MSSEPPIPADLVLIQDFVNTRELDKPGDDIGTGEALAAWARGRGLAGSHDSFGGDDVLRAQALREALRALLFHNNGEALDPEAVRTLNSVAAEAPLNVHFEPGGRASLAAARTGFWGLAASLLAAVARAEAESTFERLKACGATDCKWAYYDHSRNRSRHWCSMQICGNRAKARSYRARRHPA